MKAQKLIKLIEQTFTGGFQLGQPVFHIRSGKRGKIRGVLKGNRFDVQWSDGSTEQIPGGEIRGKGR